MTEKGPKSFYDENLLKLLSANTHLSTLGELKEKIIVPLDKEFGSKMLRITNGRKNQENFNVVCKYMCCTFRLCFKLSETKCDNGKTASMYTFHINGTHKTHTFDAHKNKDLKCHEFL